MNYYYSRRIVSDETDLNDRYHDDVTYYEQINALNMIVKDDKFYGVIVSGLGRYDDYFVICDRYVTSNMAHQGSKIKEKDILEKSNLESKWLNNYHYCSQNFNNLMSSFIRNFEGRDINSELSRMEKIYKKSGVNLCIKLKNQNIR